jgi:2-keto-3-deoxy-L-rhamnonate aldolase RhmA
VTFPANPIKQALQSGRPVIGTMIVQVREPAIVQLFAAFGLEYFIIDMEHGSYSIETAADLIQVARLSGITPLVRVNEPHYHLVSRLLDAGAQGIMTPRVETVEKVQRVMSATHYPPDGERGFSRLAAHLNYADVDSADYVRHTNQNLVNLIQIETAHGVEAIESLITVPGVDGVIVGMDDLALSLGLAGQTNAPVAVAMLERIVAACQKHSVPWGLHLPDVERLELWIGRGMQLVTFSSDVWMFQQVLRSDLPVLRNAIAARKTNE